MGLIKANNLPATSAAFSMADIEQQARAILLRARAEADQVLAEAKRQAEALKASALKDGRAAGVEQGRKEGREQAAQQGKAQALTEQRAKLTEVLAAFTKASAGVEEKLASVEQAARQEVLRLSVAIARRITRTLADRDITVAEANLREAVRIATNKSSLRIAVSPAQHEQLQAVLPQLKLAWPTMQFVELIADPSITAGGCKVFTAAGEVDADIDRQIDRIVAELVPSEDTGGQPQ